MNFRLNDFFPFSGYYKARQHELPGREMRMRRIIVILFRGVLLTVLLCLIGRGITELRYGQVVSDLVRSCYQGRDLEVIRILTALGLGLTMSKATLEAMAMAALRSLKAEQKEGEES